MMRPVPTLLALASIVLVSYRAAGDLNDPLMKLLPADGTAGDQFGSAVAISGTTAVIGAWQNDENGTWSGVCYLFDATTTHQIARLLPDDGAPFQEFGRSVAISGTRAVIGADGDSANGEYSGSAYVFDATTGEQLFKLLPGDGEEYHQFGWSSGVDGTRAIVGAPGADGTVGLAGAAYVFDTTTGQQLLKLVAGDGAEEDDFGSAVAISGTRAVIGARWNDANGDASGAAYVFDATTGQQLFKLLPTDGAASQQFGVSVAISGTRIIVGARGDDANGSFSGAAYIFDATTGEQLLKLVPDDGASFDHFGLSTAISATRAVVGAYADDDAGDGSGSAYIFDATTGQQLRKLLPEDGAAGDTFGWSVSISGVRAIAGAQDDNDGGDSAGAAYLTASDTDGDGLLDVWESNGIDINNDDVIDLDLPGMGADPFHKDLFVEVDSMIGLGFNATGQANVVQAFANVPNDLVGNPDGLDGITLHLVVDETNLAVTPFPNKFDDFDAVKAARFGTAVERADANWPNIEAARKKVFRYCIFGHSYGTTSSSGLAERPGNDFMVTLGLWSTPGGTVNQQAGTFMHEFGHTLGLGHGGGDDINRKPNYYSVMSYTWQMPQTPYSEYWRLDYSHVKLDDLDEAGLVEADGIDGSDPVFTTVLTLRGIGGEPPTVDWVSPSSTPVDWNANGMIDMDTVAADINYHFQCDHPPGPCPTPGQVLVGHNDWKNLRYSLYGASFADGVHDVTTDETEMTLEDFVQMNTTPAPPGACDADLDGDGSVGTLDLLAMLGAWGVCTECPADLDGDGVVGVLDLLLLLGEWGACR